MEWNSQLENIISDEGEKCLSFMWLHDRCQKKYNRLDTMVNVPVIVLSTLAGSASIGSESLFAGFDKASVIIGIISILVGILNTLGSYFSWSRRSEGHRISAIQYNKSYNFIKIELALPRKDRLAPHEFLKLIKDQLERLKEVSPQISDDVIDLYKITFAEYTEVSKPEICNGLDEIKIFSPMVENESIKRMSVNFSNNVTEIDLKPEISLDNNLKTQLPALKKKIPFI